MTLKNLTLFLALFLSPYFSHCMESLDEDEVIQPQMVNFYRVTLKISSTGSLSQDKLDFIENNGQLINSLEHHTIVPVKRTIAASNGYLLSASLTLKAINPDFITVDYKTEYNSWLPCLLDNLSCCASLLRFSRLNASLAISKLFPKVVKSATISIPFGEEHTIFDNHEYESDIGLYTASILAQHVIQDGRR